MITQFFEGEFVGVYPVERMSNGKERRLMAIKNAVENILVLQLLEDNINLCATLENGSIITAHYEIRQSCYTKGDSKQWTTSLVCYKIEKEPWL